MITANIARDVGNIVKGDLLFTWIDRYGRHIVRHAKEGELSNVTAAEDVNIENEIYSLNINPQTRLAYSCCNPTSKIKKYDPIFEVRLREQIGNGL